MIRNLEVNIFHNFYQIHMYLQLSTIIGLEKHIEHAELCMFQMTV